MLIFGKNLDKYSAKFLNRTQVFLMDCFVSGVCTVGVAIVSFLLAQDIFWDRGFVLVWGIAAAVGAPLMFWLLKTYAIIIRHFSFKDTAKLGLAAIGKAVVMALGALLYGKLNGVVAALLLFDIAVTTLALCSVRLVMIYVYDYYKGKIRELERRDRVLVYGINDKAVATASRLRGSKRYEVVGLISKQTEVQAKALFFLHYSAPASPPQQHSLQNYRLSGKADDCQTGSARLTLLAAAHNYHKLSPHSKALHSC